jgi:hypothetical protein
MTIRPVVDWPLPAPIFLLQPTIETNSIEFMKKIGAQRPSHYLSSIRSISPKTSRPGTIRYLPIEELAAHPISLKLLVRARGGLDTFPSLVVEEMRKAMPKLDPRRRSLDWHSACVEENKRSRA